MPTPEIRHGPARSDCLSYGALAAPLAVGGLPLYIHAPDFYAADLGVSLGLLGAVLAILRLLDAVQDPLVGWAGDRWPARRPAMMVAGAIALSLGVTGLFLPPALPVLVWFAAMMTLASLGHSLISVNLMTFGGLWRRDPAAKARISGTREAMGLAGLIVAVTLPAALAPSIGRAGALLALSAVLLLGLAVALPLFLRWQQSVRLELRAVPGLPVSLRQLRGFFAVAALVLLSAAFPAALILMLVRDLIGAEPLAGAFLLTYFVAALPGAALATRLAERHGAVRVWTGALILSVLGFAGALALGPGTVGLFLVICVLTGLTFGADLVLPPAILSERIGAANAAGAATRAHAGLAFLTKAALALAGAVALPLLAQAGFRPAMPNPETALDALRWLYGGLPLALRLLAIGLLVHLHRKGSL
ncbi:MFS transporter [Paracoccus sp. EGI L200073]|nr:MFS transporter [Paracoccus salsus]